MSLINVDFLPRCLDEGLFSRPKFEDFNVMLSNANSWLSNHTQFKVKTVESIELKCKSWGRVDSDKSTFCEKSQEMKYIRALRLWLVPRKPGEPPEPERIGHINVIPRCLEAAGIFSKPKYESFSDMLMTLNNRLRSHPIQGKVINLETQDIKYHLSSGSVNPDEAFWVETSHGVNYVNILRIFYICGPPAYEEIGMADFKPRLLDHTGVMGSSKFEPLMGMIKTAANWISRHPGLNVVSVQSVDFKVKGSAAYNEIDTHRMRYYEDGKHDTKYLRIVRVGYVIPSPNVNNYDPNPPVNLSYKTFKPLSLSSGIFAPEHETISQTVRNAASWILQTGAEVLSVETVPVRLFSGRQHGDPEVVFTKNKSQIDERILYVIRVYFKGQNAERQHAEPRNQMASSVTSSPRRQQYVSDDDECCTIL